jgi:hypothetical protein
MDLEHLSDEASAALLENLLESNRFKGIPPVKSTDRERREIGHEVRGHALTLVLIGSYIRKALRDVRRWRELNFTNADLKILGGHALKVMSAYENWLINGGTEGKWQLAVLRLLGLFDRPANAE